MSVEAPGTVLDDPTSRRLWVERQQELGTNIFYMNHADITYAQSNERRAIATHGLGGCSGLVVQFEDTQKGALVAHYSPMVIAVNGHEKRLSPLLSRIESSAHLVGALILHPGEKDPSSPTGYKAWDSSCSLERIGKLSNLVRANLGKNVPLFVGGYCEIGRGPDRNEEQGTVIVEFSGDGSSELRVGGVKVDLEAYAQI